MTIAKQLKIKEFPFEINDSNGNRIYWEDSDGTIIDNRPKTDVQKAIDLLTKEGLLVDGKILKTKIQS